MSIITAILYLLWIQTAPREQLRATIENISEESRVWQQEYGSGSDSGGWEDEVSTSGSKGVVGS